MIALASNMEESLLAQGKMEKIVYKPQGTRECGLLTIILIVEFRGDICQG